MKPRLILAALLIAPLSTLLAEDKPDTTHWKEDFSDEAALKKNWSKYDAVLPGGDKTQRFWQIEDGVLRGRAFGKVHPVGIMREVSGKDLRFTCRIKLGEGAGLYVNFSGPNRGSDHVSPEQAGINFRRAGLHIAANNQVMVFDDYYTHPDAEALKKEGTKQSAGKVTGVKFPLTVNAWHDLKVEMLGKEITAWIDGTQVLTYTTHSGEEAKTLLSFSVGNESKNDTVDGWYDDMVVEPIEEAKK